MASTAADITVKVRLDDRELRAIRDWMGNALAAIATIAAKTPCTHEERAMITAWMAAMEAAGAVLWEVRESQGEQSQDAAEDWAPWTAE